MLSPSRILVLPFAAENYIPGPSFNFAEQDLGFSDKRSNGRHYLAFMEAIEARRLDAFPYRRLRRVLDTRGCARKPALRRIYRAATRLVSGDNHDPGRYLLAALIGLSLLPSAGLGSETPSRSAERPHRRSRSPARPGRSNLNSVLPRSPSQGLARFFAKSVASTGSARGARCLCAVIRAWLERQGFRRLRSSRRCYSSAEGGPRDPTQAERLLKQAIAAGGAEAANFLADHFETGYLRSKQDPADSTRALYRTAFRLGDAAAGQGTGEGCWGFRPRLAENGRRNGQAA